ncbi:MAG: hypothetical protein KGM18_12405 [Sphingomonadales bacterium]|nr:hypothetical protein [Sphingomonadales bacterium]
MEKIVGNVLTPEQTYDVLDAYITDVFAALGVVAFEGEALANLLRFDRALRIALRLPVEVSN